MKKNRSIIMIAAAVKINFLEVVLWGRGSEKKRRIKYTVHEC